MALLQRCHKRQLIQQLVAQKLAGSLAILHLLQFPLLMPRR
jgi:hypothetical protein